MISQYWLLLLVVPFALLGLRAYIRAVAEKSVQHSYDARLESLKGEIRQSEERLKSELRNNESEIAALRDGALGGRASRLAMLDKRRLEAVERLWRAVTELAPLKGLAATLGVIKFEESAKLAARNANAREMFKAMGSAALEQERPGEAGALERPFVSPLSWALFSAYRTVLVHAWAKIKILTVGADEPEKIFTYEPMRKMLTEAIPDKSAFILTADPAHFHMLLDELEVAILSELGRMMDGEEDDQQAVRRAAAITKSAAEAAIGLKAEAQFPAELDGG